MNKQSLKTILYALLALLIIISLFNCFKKESIEDFKAGPITNTRGHKNCPRGRESRKNRGNKCIKCNQSYYKDTRGKGTCVRCPNTQITDKNGAKSINDCRCGYRSYFDEEKNSCQSCLPGTSNTKGTIGKACNPCPENTQWTPDPFWNSKELWNQCKPCPEGQVSDEGSAFCQQPEPDPNNNIRQGDVVVNDGFYKHLNETRSEDCPRNFIFMNNQNQNAVCKPCQTKLVSQPFNDNISDWPKWAQEDSNGNTPKVVKDQCPSFFIMRPIIQNLLRKGNKDEAIERIRNAYGEHYQPYHLRMFGIN